LACFKVLAESCGLATNVCSFRNGGREFWEMYSN